MLGIQHIFSTQYDLNKASPMAHRVKNQPANAGDTGDKGSIPGSGRCPGKENGYPLYSCLKNSMDRGAWKTTDYGVTRFGHDSD